MTKKLLLLFAAGLLFRLVALNQSLWLDEAISANVVSRYSFIDIITRFSPSDFHPPLYYLLLKLWASLFGTSEIALRLPSVIASLITAFVLYRTAALIKSSSLGYWSALFFLFNPLMLYYSQEARMYSLATLFLSLAFYHFCRFTFTSTPSSRSLWFFNLFTALSFLTFYGSAFFIAAFFLYLLLTKKYRLLYLSLPGFILSLLLLSPLLFRQLQTARSQLDLVVNWSSVLGQVSLKNLALIPLKFSIGRISFFPKWLYYLISLPWTIFVIGLLLPTFRRHRRLFFFLLTPLVLCFIFSFVSPMLQYFRFLYLLPLFSLLLAFATLYSPLKFPLAFGFFAWSLLYLLNSNFHREDWKTLSMALPIDAHAYMIPTFSDPVSYYRSDVALADLSSLSAGKNLIILIPYGQAIHGLDSAAKLTQLGYHRTFVQSFREVTLEYWEP